MNRLFSNRILFLLSIAGLFISGYLTLMYVTEQHIGCGRSSGCDEVAASEWANGLGIPFLRAIPTPAFGLLLYLVLAGLSFTRAATDSPAVEEWAQRLQWAISFVGVLVSGYLTYLEAYVIHAWCKWCLASAAILLLIFLTATAERLRAAPPSSPMQSEVT